MMLLPPRGDIGDLHPVSGRYRPPAPVGDAGAVRRLTSGVVVGREEEVDLLRRQVHLASRGRGGTLALVAEPGLGKSRLAREAAAEAVAAGATVLRGRAVATAPAGAFRPLAEVVLARWRDGSLAAEPALDPFRGPLTRVAPVLGGGEDVGEAPLVLVAEAFLQLLRTAAGPAGCLLVLEDLHWADPETLAVVEFLADNLAGEPVACLLTMRPDPPPARRLAHGLEARGATEVVHLDRLGDDDVERLTAACLGGAPPAEVLELVTGWAEGVPLFVEELLAGLASTGALRRGADGWELAGPLPARVPTTFAATVEERLAGLDAATRRLVEAAAVLGRRFDWRLLGPMVGCSGDEVLAGLRRALDVQLVVVEGDGFSLRHALVADAVRTSLLPPERADLAGRALAALDAGRRDLDGADLELAADLAVAAGAPARAAELLLDAARAAASAGALTTAEATLRRAAPLAAGSPTARDVGEALTEVLVLAGRTDEARAVGQEVLAELGQAPGAEGRRIRILLAQARAAVTTGQWDDAASHLAAAAVLHEEAPDEVLLAGIRAVQAHVAVNRNDLPAAVEAAEEAVDLATRTAQPPVACEALEVLGRAVRFTDPERARACFERAAALAQAHGLGTWRVRALHEIAIGQAFGELDPAGLWRVREAAVATGALVTVAVVDLHLAGITLLLARDPHAGGEIARRCVDACRRYQLSMLPMALVHVAAADALLGRREEAEKGVAEALALAPDDPNIVADRHLWVRADLALVAGDLERWRAELDAGAAALRGRPGAVPSPFRALWPLARLAVGGADDGARDEVRASEVMAVAGAEALLGAADAVVAGREGRVAEAEALVRSADAVLAAFPLGAWLQQLVRLLVSLAAGRDDWGRPAEWLREAEAYFAARGDEGLAGRCRRALRETGAPVPRRGRGSSEVPPALRALGVTSREMDVLLLIAARRSNKEIASQLHLSPRTVEKHVASLLTRTGAPGRRGLADLVP
jgi:DNA-binding CsgD family transcriptional regulator